MPAVKDPYKTLGVDKKASDDEIKKAYRKLARRWHPDTNPDDPAAEERFKEIQEANGILSDPEKRKQYDAGGGIFGGFGGGGGAGAGGFDPSSFRGGFGGVGDILSDILGGRGGGAARGSAGARAGQQRGRDLEVEVHLSFAQAMDGAQVPVTVPMQAPCNTCRGTGARPGTSPTVCPRCQGRGIESQGQGLFSISQPCSLCGGTGAQIDDPCPTCGGRGQTRQVKRYKANIPAGVREGSRVRLAGKGEPGQHGGPPGDLYVITRVAGSPVFTRKGENLEVDIPDHHRRGHSRRHRRGPDARRDEAHPRARRHPARHGSAPARGGTPEARGPRARRHPLPPPGGRAELAQPRAGARSRRARRGHARRSARRPARPGGGQGLMTATPGTGDGAAERRRGAGADPARGVYMISIAAELAGMHPQTLRIYETRGLITPKRSPKNTRLYSHEDVQRLRRIQELTTELGLNLAGVERVTALERELERARRRADRLERELERTREAATAEVERVRRTYRHEMVRYEAPGSALVPVRRRRA